MNIYARKLLTPAGWREDQVVEIHDGVITAVRPGTSGCHAADILAPGLIDLHNHGGEGLDLAARSADTMKAFLEKMLAGGTTDMLMTVGTGDPEILTASLGFVRETMALQSAGTLGGTRIQGVHMEGPFLSAKRPGAMNPKSMLKPDPAAFERLLGEYMDMIKMVTVAPEEDESFALTAWLLGRGIKVQAGHTDASFEQAQAAFAAGVDSLCHTFNAARPIHHREPGIISAALTCGNVYCEAICDLEHLHPGAIRLIYHCKGPSRMVLVSDSTTATGLPDGEYRFGGGRAIIVKDGVKRTPAGNLSGGGCYLDQAVRNLVSAVGIPLEDALTMAGRTPARRMGFDKLGKIQPGYSAHLAAYSADMLPVFSVIGDVVYGK